MSDVPAWYSQLRWSPARSIRAIRANMSQIPHGVAGCYVFTRNSGEKIPGKVLYVGKAINLRTRLPGYLVDYMKTRPTKHKGRAFMFEARSHSGDNNIYLQWTQYGDPNRLEAGLIDYLEPQCNDRFEQDGFYDDESLDEKFIYE